MIRKAFVLLLLAGCAAPGAGESSVLRVGAARVDITPPVGARRAGGYEEIISTGVHDPLHVRAIVLEQGGESAAIVVADLCGVSREVSDPARRRASERTGIPVERIVLSATHNHGGPEYTGVLWDVWRDRAVAKHGRDVHAPIDYAARLVDAVGEVVELAHRARTSARLERGLPKLPGIAFNRRFHMKDGSVRFNPGRRNPSILRPAGPVDEDLPLVVFRDLGSGAPLASLCSFAMHTAVYGGRDFGADFPGRLDDGLRAAFGPSFVSVFAEGAAGDVNHVDVSRTSSLSPVEESARIGRAMTDAVLAVVPGLAADDAALGAGSVRVRVPVRDAPEAEAAKARETIAMTRGPVPFDDLVSAYRTLWTRRIRERDGAAAREEVQVFRLGRETAVVCLPHEVFVELGMEIRRRSPFEVTLVVSLANDIDFYVPTRKAFGEGSYEVSTSPYLPGGGEILVEAAVRLLEELGR